MERKLIRLLALTLLAIFAAIYTLPPTPLPGDGDPIYYAHASRTLRAGDGLLNVPDAPASTVALVGESGALYAAWPPLYPALLALFERPRIGAWVINAASLAITLLATAHLLRLLGLPRMMAAFVLLSPLMPLYRQPVSEPLFIALSLVWLLLVVHIERDDALLALSAVSAALCMQRTIGALYVVLGVALVLLYTRSLVRVAAYAALPGMALVWWVSRNYYSLGAALGARAEGGNGWALAWWSFGETLIQWLMLLVFAAVCCGLWRYFSSRIARSSFSLWHRRTSTS